MPKYNLSIYRDAMSPSLLAVMLDEEGRGGLQLTSSKGCGSWQLVKSWPLSFTDLRDLAGRCDAAANAIEDAEKEVCGD